VFENRVLKRDEVTRVWRRLRNEEFYYLYSSQNVIEVVKSRRMRWEVYVACRVFVGRPEGKKPLGRPRHRWEDNIKMDLKAVGWGGIDWIGLGQGRALGHL
jgi:hypothetical protein